MPSKNKAIKLYLYIMTDEPIQNNISTPAPSIPPPSSTDPAELAECDSCGNIINSQIEGIFNSTRGLGTKFCKRCVSECDNCKEWRPTSEMGRDPLSRYSTDLYCEDCFTELFSICPNCNKTVSLIFCLEQKTAISYERQQLIAQVAAALLQ
jgi:hypothetical protein